jgi:hypothetical protein
VLLVLLERQALLLPVRRVLARRAVLLNTLRLRP